MADINDYIRAAAAARQAGDMAAHDRLFAKATSMQQQYSPVEGMSGPQKFAAGMGQGATNVARQAGNIIGRNSDEQMAEWKANDAPLLNTSAGKWGQFAGEVAATAPIGGVVGGLVRRGAAKAGATVLTKALSGAV